MPGGLVAAQVLGRGNLRRLMGCGCGAAIALVALPVFVVFSLLTGLLPSSGNGSASQVDAATGTVIGAAQPLPAGSFTVSQGFGCTSVATEPSPPHGYTCPPDEAHPDFVRFHTGIDLAAPTGVPVFAVAAGVVQVVTSSVGFGLHVLLTPLTPSTPPVVYLFGHLSAVRVSDGEQVTAAELIGWVGSTGNSTGPHLHFEVDAGGVPVNPCATFPRGYLVPAGVAAVGCLAWEL
jgi:murein DD-endopeptidase MepM/ murein hydrolase activator NlpD